MSWQERADEVIELLHSTLGTVVREQAGMDCARVFALLSDAMRKWREDGGPVSTCQEAISAAEKLDAEGLAKLERGLALSLLLDDTAFALLEASASSEGEAITPDTLLSSASKRYADAKARPLPKRRYPPFPQLQIVLTPESARGRWGRAQLEHARELGRDLMQWMECAPGSQRAGKLKLAMQSKVWLIWQSQDAPTDTTPSARFRAMCAPGRFIDEHDHLTPINDAYAQALGIDPRFANFVPFVTLYAQAKLAEAQGLERVFAAFGAQSLQALASELRDFQRECTQHADHATYGNRVLALASRLCPNGLEDEQVKRNPLRAALGQIIAKVEASQAMLSGEGKDDSPATSYQHPASLIVDLKQLHQSVGEIPGGYTLAPRVRNWLMRIGAQGFHVLPQAVVVDASALASSLTELGMRAGVLEQTLASFEAQARSQAAGTLIPSVDRIVRMLPSDEGWQGLSQETRTCFDGLLALRKCYARFGSECLPRMVIAGVNDPADMVVALACLHLADALADLRDGKRAESARLTRNVSLAPELSPLNAPADALLLLERLRGLRPYADYLDSRGGHQEIALSSPSALDPCYASILRERFVRELTRDAKASGLILTFRMQPLSRAGGLAGSQAIEAPASELFSSFGNDSFTQHVAIEAGSGFLSRLGGNSLASAARAQLALVGFTDALYLHPELKLAPAQVERYREVLLALGKHANAAYQDLGESLKRDLPDHPQASAIRSFVAEWYGLSKALDALLNGKLALSGLPEDQSARLAGIKEAAEVWPTLRNALRLARDGMSEYSLVFLSAYAWQHFPSGSFSQSFPRIEQAWRKALELFDLLAPAAPLSRPALRSLARGDALKLVQLSRRKSRK